MKKNPNNQQIRRWPKNVSGLFFLISFVIVLLTLQGDATFFVCNNDANTPSENQKATMAREAFEQRRMMRAGDDGTIPFGALVRAKEHIDEMPTTDDAGIWDWEWLGPGNIGGRIRAILIHPDDPAQIWIGSASGGIWKSNNGGGSWAPVNDFMANLAITSIVIDPINHLFMYASTGEGFCNGDALEGAGIFISTNAGLSWTQLPNTNNANFSYVTRLAHHPTISGKLYAVTSKSFGAWHSDDYGLTWERILTTGWPATDIGIHPTQPHRLIVGTNNEVYLSQDSGAIWVEQTTGVANKLPDNPGRCEVIFSPADAETIYVSMDRDQNGGANKGEIWRSTDSGDTWELRCTGWGYLGKQGCYDNCIWVSPVDNDHVIVGGIDLWQSFNGGPDMINISDWHEYHTGLSAHADHHIIVNHPDYDGESNLTVFFGNDGGIQKTDNILEIERHSGWINLAGTTLGITQFYGGAAAPNGSFIVGGTQDNCRPKYTPATGTNWFNNETGDGGFAAVNYNNYNYVFGEHVHLSMKRSTNKGDTYSNFTYGLLDAGNKEKSLFIAPFVMDPNNPEIIIAGGENIWRTTNSSGVSFLEYMWSKIRTGSPIKKCSAIDIAKGNSSVIWVGYDNGEVWKTLDNAVSWDRVDGSPPYAILPDRYVTDIAINPKNSSEVFVTFGEYELNGVWYTDNAGAEDSWEQRTGAAPYDLPAIQVNTIRFHPSNSDWVYVGTDLGIFASEDRGLNWNRTPLNGDHDGPANVEVDELFWQADFLVAATHGRGMYRCRPLDIIYVDKSTPQSGNGSLLYPFKTVTEAENAAGPGSQIMIYGNDYDEGGLIFHKRGLIKSTEGSAVIK